MSQPPPSTPRPILTNTTNVESSQTSQPDDSKTLVLRSPTSISKRRADRNWTLGTRKRVKTETKLPEDEELSDESDSDSDSDLEEPVPSTRRHNVFGIRDAWMMAGPSNIGRLATLPTRPKLQAFVSSNRSDIYLCTSQYLETLVTVPYACAYSHGAKRGDNHLLAVATEEGSIFIVPTPRREPWDNDPSRTWQRIHQDAIFDIQWSPSDKMLATASADKMVQITSREGGVPLYQMYHHRQTIKCAVWDPVRQDYALCTASRDGMICLWDLRVGDGNAIDSRKPVAVISNAHGGGRRTKSTIAASPVRGVTSVVFPEHDSNVIISSGSFDGSLRQWDLRFMDTKRHETRQRVSPKSITTPLLTSIDPTTYNGTRRGRGITSLVHGTAASAGLLFALSADSRIHTYDARTLEPLSGSTADPATDAWSYAHESMRAYSFYVRLSISPCGRWLASGGSKEGTVYLYDVTSSAAARRRGGGGDMRARGVRLQGQAGEIGAVDWAKDTLATCGDDRTVRAWREDLELYRRCREDPEEMKLDWRWSVED